MARQEGGTSGWVRLHWRRIQHVKRLATTKRRRVEDEAKMG